MDESSSYLAGVQVELPDSSTVNFSQEEPQELLTQVEQLHRGLELEQKALVSLQRRLENVLGSSSSQDTVIPGAIEKGLKNIQERIMRWN